MAWGVAPYNVGLKSKLARERSKLVLKCCSKFAVGLPFSFRRLQGIKTDLFHKVVLHGEFIDIITTANVAEVESGSTFVSRNGPAPLHISFS